MDQSPRFTPTVSIYISSHTSRERIIPIGYNRETDLRGVLDVGNKVLKSLPVGFIRIH
jgi:hypothetical protein